MLPRYLPIDADRHLTAALTEHPGNELAALALRLQRACGLRIGELLDLELDCVHEIDGNGAWLKVPLGKPMRHHRSGVTHSCSRPRQCAPALHAADELTEGLSVHGTASLAAQAFLVAAADAH